MQLQEAIDQLNNKISQTEIKNEQHDEILNSHNHHAKNTTYTSSKTNAIIRHEKQSKNLKQTSMQPNVGGNSDQILAELIHKMPQATMATENLRECYGQKLKLN